MQRYNYFLKHQTFKEEKSKYMQKNFKRLIYINYQDKDILFL